ncbi:MAG: lipocalin family protein [Pseudomonadales bacterium]
MKRPSRQNPLTRRRCVYAAVLALVTVFLGACLGTPEKVKPVEGFEMQRYLGTWYEIARLDHSFERGLQRVSAQYTPREDGGISVLNRGYDPEAGEWREADGRAYFVEGDTRGYLKVSFFGPFYGSYVIFELDKNNYQYAFVSGPNEKFLWLLARTADPADSVIEYFLEAARERDFDVESLIFVDHDTGGERVLSGGEAAWAR